MARNKRTAPLYTMRKFALTSALVTLLPACSGVLGDRGEERNASQIIDGPRRPPLLNPRGELGKMAASQPELIGPQGFVPPKYAAELPEFETPKQPMEQQANKMLEVPLERNTPPKPEPSTWDSMLDAVGLGEEKPSPPAPKTTMENMALERSELIHEVQDTERKPLPSNPRAQEFVAKREKARLVGSPLVVPTPTPPAPHVIAELETPKERLLAAVSSDERNVVDIAPAQYVAPTPPQEAEEEFDFFGMLFGRADNEPSVPTEPVPPVAIPERKPLLRQGTETVVSETYPSLYDAPQTPLALPEAQRAAPAMQQELEADRLHAKETDLQLRQEVEEDKPNSLREEMQRIPTPEPLPAPTSLPTQRVPTRPRVYLPPPSPPRDLQAYLLPEFARVSMNNAPDEGATATIESKGHIGTQWIMPANTFGISYSIAATEHI